MMISLCTSRLDRQQLYQSPVDPSDLAMPLLLHEGVQDSPSAAVGGEGALGLVHLLPDLSHRLRHLAVHLGHVLQLALVLAVEEKMTLERLIHQLNNID